MWDEKVPLYVASLAKYHKWIALPPFLNFAKKRLQTLTGLPTRDKLRKEQDHICDIANQVVNIMPNAAADEIMKNEYIVALIKNEEDALFVKQVVDALVYDPTL